MNKRAIYKNLRQQLSKLPKPYRQEALDEFNRQVKSGLRKAWVSKAHFIENSICGYQYSYQECLLFAFSWGKAKKGFNYWYVVDRDLFR